MKLYDLLFGKPLRSSEEAGEKLGPVGGLSVFGLDALSSAAYGPEAALTLLIPLAAAGIAYILPIMASIIILLVIVYFSYRQTIVAYPSGGGSYTVARQNLGDFSGLLAAAALMIDYVLTAAVGISAGVGALVSAVPSLQPHTLLICLVILLLITIVNLRGVRETGAVFIVPTYLFVGTMLVTLLVRTRQDARRRRPSLTGRCSAALAPAHCRGQHLAFAQGFFQRLYRHDRRRGDQQRRQSIPRAAGENPHSEP